MDRRQTITYLLTLLAAGVFGIILFDIRIVSPSDAATPAAAAYSIGEIEQTGTPLPVRYIEIIHSCGPHFEGECVTVRSSPATSSPAISRVRNGTVLRVSERIHTEDGDWYHIVFDEWVRYPSRIHGSWYISADYALPIEGAYEPETLSGAPATTTKRIMIDRSEQMLYAYDGDTLFLTAAVSTGLELTPTPRGTFHVYYKTPSRYMQGPLPGISDQYYDLPGVSWNLYFTKGGGAIHGAYWHNSFGQRWSHGCVNLPVDVAHKLYDWAPLGTPVIVQD